MYCYLLKLVLDNVILCYTKNMYEGGGKMLLYEGGGKM